MAEEEFTELRPSAFAIAYRMLGSVSEAEAVVQEGFLRLHRARARAGTGSTLSWSTAVREQCFSTRSSA
jgi:DNA-directed RNA polymerase specialized sigma24 family protein